MQFLPRRPADQAIEAARRQQSGAAGVVATHGDISASQTTPTSLSVSVCNSSILGIPIGRFSEFA